LIIPKIEKNNTPRLYALQGLDPIALAVIIFIKIREKRVPITKEGYSIRIFLLLLKTL
jgi:hypothetical protein